MRNARYISQKMKTVSHTKLNNSMIRLTGGQKNARITKTSVAAHTSRKIENRTIQKIVEGMRGAAVIVVTWNAAIVVIMNIARILLAAAPTNRRTENLIIQKIVEGMSVAAAVVVTMSAAKIRKAVNQAVEGDDIVALTMLMTQVNLRKAILIQRTSVKKQRSQKAPAAVAKNQRTKRLERRVNTTATGPIRVVTTTAIAAQENGLNIVIKVNIKRKPKRVNMRDPAHVPDLVTGVAGNTNKKKWIVYLKTFI